MRVGFCGASGTGKTRLMEHLVGKHGLPACPVGSRQVAKAMGFDNPYDVDRAGMRAAFQRRLFVEKRAWEEQNDEFASDRTAFDNLAYATMHGARMRLEEVGEYVDAMYRLTHVVYLPVVAFQRVGDDPARVQEAGYHHMFDMVLRALLAEYQIPHLRLGGPVDKRQERLDAYLVRPVRG